MYNILVYFGKETSFNPELSQSGQAEKVFEYLLRPLGKGHHAFADRYYTSYNLIKFLCDNSTYYTGTLALNRRNFPADLKNIKLAHRKSRWFRSEDQKVLCVAWRDKKAKKPCVLVSTESSVKTVSVRRKQGSVDLPEVVHSYNKTMNGCDRVDQAVAYYGQFSRKTKKWWKCIFLWLLEICQCN